MNGFEIHTLSIKRPTLTRGPLGGVLRTFSAAARGSLPISTYARAVVLTAKERVDHGVRSEHFGWKFLTKTDPQIALNDIIEFDYSPGDSRIAKVSVPSRARFNANGDIHHWVTIGVEDLAEL